jgi:hypothetical protein
MAQTIIGTFKGPDEARRAVDALIGGGVPRQDIAIARGGDALAVTTDAILGSAVYDILRGSGASKTEVRHDAERLTGWERLDPHSDSREEGREREVSPDAEAWRHSSKVGTATGAVAGAAAGAGLGAAGGPVGAVIGGVAGGIVGAATGGAADIAGEVAREAIEEDDGGADEDQ